MSPTGAAPFAYQERSAAGPGAIRLVALAGAGAERAFIELAGRPPPLPGQVRLERLRLGTEWLDEALAVGLPAGGVELSLHGGPALIAALMTGLAALGGRRECVSDPLLPQRCGGLPGLEQRAAGRLLEAQTPFGARLLLDAAEGRLSHRLRSLPFLTPPQLESAVAACVERTRAAWPLWRPVRVLLLGPTNAGKSTLFNALLGRQAALVSPLPGTTRDYLAERAPLGGCVVEWIDTAGARELPGELLASGGDTAQQEQRRHHWQLEVEGQRRARELAQEVDLVLWLTPVDQPVSPPAGLGVPTLELASFARSRPGHLGQRLACDALAEPEATCTRLEAAVMARLGLDRAADWLAWPTLFDPLDVAYLSDLPKRVSSADRWRHLLAWP
jgi:tRNA modification GTPase